MIAKAIDKKAAKLRDMPRVRKSIMGAFLVTILLAFSQLYGALTLRFSIRETFNDNSIQSIISGHPVFEPIPHLAKNESFGACVMIKEDNDLLYEWLAYHFTVLPLRYVFVGSDLGNQQNPEDALERWKTANTGLEYWVVNASNFTDRHGPRVVKDDKEDAHHSFVHRQKGFITTCTEFMKAQGLDWVTFTDSDEFIVMNRLGNDDNLTMQPSKDPHAVDPSSYQLRQALPLHDSGQTILETIRSLNGIQNLSPCYTLPRVLFGALENTSCPEAQDVQRMARSKFRYDDMSTLRFAQHARKGDFSMSKFGKVMMDVSNLSDTVITQRPRNIHRPYKPECRPGVVHFPEALFYLNHYIGSWQRYSSRVDNRRNRQEWEKRAYITAATSCDQGVHRWFPQFLDIVGPERASFLLGGLR